MDRWQVETEADRSLLAEALRKARLEQGLFPETVATRLSKPLSEVTEWEDGIVVPKSSELLRVLRFYRVPWSERQPLLDISESYWKGPLLDPSAQRTKGLLGTPLERLLLDKSHPEPDS